MTTTLLERPATDTPFGDAAAHAVYGTTTPPPSEYGPGIDVAPGPGVFYGTAHLALFGPRPADAGPPTLTSLLTEHPIPTETHLTDPTLPVTTPYEWPATPGGTLYAVPPAAAV